LLLSHQGKQVKELAAIFSVIPLTIYSWFYRWEDKGLVGLFNEKGRGRKLILLQTESEKIKTQVQAHAQQLKVARGILKAELNKEFSHKTLRRFLKKLLADGNAGEKA
jgi:transposase